MGLASIQDSINASIQWKEDYIRKRGWKLITATRINTDYRTKIGRKTTVWTFQATNKHNLQKENLDMAKNGKTFERNRIFSDRSTKQCSKDYVKARIDKMQHNSKYIFVFFNFHDTTCESTCDTLSSSAAN